MRSLLRVAHDVLTKHGSARQYAQALLVLIAFTLMVISSYFFMSQIESRNLRQSAESTIRNTEANIKSDMLELETLLGIASQTIRNMLISGNDENAVNEYILFINNYVEENRGKRLYGATGIFGVFDIFGGLMLIGYDSWIPPDDYYQTDRPWYIEAIIAAGEIITTEPYLNVYSNETTITLSRQIFNIDGSAMGIICLNIELDRIQQYVVNTKFVEGGYGFLLSKNNMIIAHPDLDKVGMLFSDVKSEIPAFQKELMEKGKISEAVARDYRNINTIVFMERLQNGWYMGIVTPRDRYFQSTKNLALTLSVLGFIFAVLLIWMLINISIQKESSEERMKVMFNATPLGAYIFNKDFKVIDCNQNAASMFDLSSKQEFCDRYFELLPEYQSDGRLTAELGMELTKKTMEEGTCTYEWLYKKLNGELIPCEITCTRVKYKNDFTLVSYLRDLRDQKKMLKEIQLRARLLDTVNSAATVLLSSNNFESFETSLLKSFDLVGCCLDVDRVQIWRNEMFNDGMYFVLRYEWLSDYGKTCKPFPYDVHFSYESKKEWENIFMRGENINAPISKLSKEDQEFLGYYDMKSIVIIPMFLNENFWGFFSIDDCRFERTFSNEEISILTSAGLMMTSAVNRNIQAVKMREAEERTQMMIDAAPLCAIFWDKNLNLLDCNQEAVKMFELSNKQEFMNNFFHLSPELQSDGVSSAEKGGRLIREALIKGNSRFEWTHQKLNGEPIPAEVICIRVKHMDDFTVIEYIRDLREQKAMIAEMRKAELAEESSKAKSDFLAKMSHEIRTPMNAILGIAEIQLQDMSIGEQVKDAFERIYNSGDLLLGIINDILDLSKIEAGKLELVLAQYEIASLIHDTVQLNIMRYEGKPIEFMLEVDKDIPLLLFGDELRIKQILNNLLSNAFKYTQEGQIKMSVSIDMNMENKGSMVLLVFSISDTGQGMTTEQIRKLGTEYSRFNMEANRRTEGTGLGMSITRNLIHLMNGGISIDSTPGMGSTFKVTLPQKRASSSAIGKDMAEKLINMNYSNSPRARAVQIMREFMPYGRVLVVDDVETNLYVAKGLMMPYGLSIDTAMSGFEAVDRVRDGNVYDIIFMDHMMPRMDGIEAAKIIRSLGYTRPIVALTANALTGQAEIFLKNGFDDFISKPIDIRQLNMSLNKLIRDKQPPDVVEAARQQRSDTMSENTHIDSQLAEFFIRDAKNAINILKSVYLNKCRRKDDLSILTINVHAMKSALANVGEDDLSSRAARLEQAGRDQNLSLILAELPSFIEMLFNKVGQYTAAVNLEYEDEPFDFEINEDDNLYLKENLLIIQAACAEYDKKAAKDALSVIKQKHWPQSVRENLSSISGFLLHSEFDEMVKFIDDYTKTLS